MMIATCSLTSRTKWSATPDCVCRTVQQRWMLWKNIIQLLYSWLVMTILFFIIIMFLCVPWWVLQCVQIPALWSQRIRQTENIENVWAYCHHWHLWVPKHKHTFNLTDSVNKKVKERVRVIICIKVQELWCCFLTHLYHISVLLCFDFACCADNLLGGIYVSILSHVHHGRPAGGDDSSRPGAGNRGRGVDSSLPVWSYKVLVVTVLFITVEDHWGTFGGVTILERNVVTHNAVLAYI